MRPSTSRAILTRNSLTNDWRSTSCLCCRVCIRKYSHNWASTSCLFSITICSLSSRCYGTSRELFRRRLFCNCHSIYDGTWCDVHCSNRSRRFSIFYCFICEVDQYQGQDCHGGCMIRWAMCFLQSRSIWTLSQGGLKYQNECRVQ